MKYFLWSFTDHDVASRLLISTHATPCCEKKRKDLVEVVAESV